MYLSNLLFYLFQCNISFSHLNFLSVYPILSVYSGYLSGLFSICQVACLSIYPIHLILYRSSWLAVYLFIHLSIYFSPHFSFPCLLLPALLCTCLCCSLTIYEFFSLSLTLSLFLSLSLPCLYSLSLKLRLDPPLLSIYVYRSSIIY